MTKKKFSFDLCCFWIPEFLLAASSYPYINRQCFDISIFPSLYLGNATDVIKCPPTGQVQMLNHCIGDKIHWTIDIANTVLNAYPVFILLTSQLHILAKFGIILFFLKISASFSQYVYKNFVWVCFLQPPPDAWVQSVSMRLLTFF